MNILGIETSCDETACALVQDGTVVLANVVASSAEMHQKTGGIVPEVAARKQVESIVPVIAECVSQAKINVPEDIDAIAVTYGPGLIGSLMVGVDAAKSLALGWNKPLIPVNHLIGHIYGVFVENTKSSEIKFPAVVLIVSGGHTDLVLMKDHGIFTYLGGTVDDAAGEAFDKVARLLGLSKYLGGVELSKLAASCVNNGARGTLPRPMLDQDNFDVSFSGLKTAVMRLVERGEYSKAEVACEFEASVVDVLVNKTMRALVSTEAPTVILGGGVSANTQLRTRLSNDVLAIGKKIFVPELKYCGDSGAYIASAAYFNNKQALLNSVVPNPSLGILG